MRALEWLRDAMIDHPKLYSHWLLSHQPSLFDRRTNLAFGAESEGLQPIALHLHISGSTTSAATVTSVLGQLHRRWILYITSEDSCPALPDDPRILVLNGHCASRAKGLARVLGVARESHLVPLSPEIVLTQGALLAFARAAIPGTTLYADQDENGPQGRESPWLKPEWDEDLFLAQDYISDSCALPINTNILDSIDPDCPDDIAIYSLLIRLLFCRSRTSGTPFPVVHVPYIAVTTPIGHWRRERPVRNALVSAIVGLPTRPGPFGTLALARPLPSPPPKVSVIVPTRDRLDLLRISASGVLHGTDYPAIEMIIVDNDSMHQETIDYFSEVQRDPRVKVISWPHPYNYSAVNNFAVAQASGPYICLLNNDTEVIDPAWLTEMMAHATRVNSGAVGARLLYPDRTVQHAGVLVGIGNAAGHAHRGQQEDAPGYFAQVQVARQVTAVTAACLVVAKDKFEAVGGLDEQNLGIAYNDVDLCLKLRAAGWSNLYVPQAVMIHHESKSRGTDFAPEHRERYMRELAVLQERWGTVDFLDPAHHAALDRTSEIYQLRL